MSPNNNNSDEAARAKAQSTKIRRAVILMIVINIILPIVLYSVLTKWLSDVAALAVSGIPPALDAILTIIRAKKMEPVASIVVLSIILAIIVSVVTQDAKLLLAKESLTSICIGIGFLVSTTFTRGNLIWMYNQLFSPSDDDTRAKLEAQWRRPGVRSFTNRLCVLWGVGLLLESALRIVLIYQLDTKIMVYVSPALLVASMAVLVGITVAYTRFVMKKYAAQIKAAEEAEALEAAAAAPGVERANGTPSQLKAVANDK
ncbi:hypothetical protein HDU96_000970 [Phlyctochytrium bullatum]|nr:hypothetical protein HDU96_000970 [Phlyctochytrium bullatum]